MCVQAIHVRLSAANPFRWASTATINTARSAGDLIGFLNADGMAPNRRAYALKTGASLIAGNANRRSFTRKINNRPGPSTKIYLGTRFGTLSRAPKRISSPNQSLR